MHSTGTGACQSRACYTLFVIAMRLSNKGKKTQIKSRREGRTEIRSEHPWGQYGIENVRDEGRCGRLRFARDGAWHGRARSAGGSLLGPSSPRGLSDGPGATGVGAPMPRLRCPPGGHPTLPGTKGMTVLPPIFDTTPGLGANKLRATCLLPFLHLRGRFETLAPVVNFSPSRAGKFRRRAKTPCVVVHHCRGVSPAEQNNNANARGPNLFLFF
jgi:hypothetical protein